ncbi:MAG: HD domain-containing protein [Desulfovibrio sp.]|nr:HD domain-containing protein [Desulfovibrio sp.]MBI4960005.1 HD domain-containing protein [Desulfovibrio sp.]
MEIYLVGGAVRDILLGRAVTDRDYLVDHADQAAFTGRYPTARLVGKSFPVFILDGSEYAWPRGGSLEADLLLRDLTINAIALGEGGMLHAHPTAITDLQAGVLRPCSPSSLKDDPVRVFRAARFAAQFPNFSPSPELLAQMRVAAAEGLLHDHAAERVGREVSKALAAPCPSRFFELLERTNCLAPWFGELLACIDVPAGPPEHHDKDVFGHTCEIMDRLAGDPLAVWMALAHDLGKTLTPREVWPSHHGHEKAGVGLAQTLGLRLRLPRSFIDAGMMAAGEHMLVSDYERLRTGTKVDLLLRMEAKRLTTRMFKLAAADSQNQDLALLRRAKRDLRAIRKVKLPDDKRDLGEKSGELLRQLRCEAIAARDPDA